MNGKPQRALGRNVFLLGLTSMFGDVASEMVVPLLPAFLVMLGGGASFIGLIEGLAEAVASLFKYLSGQLADRARSLKPLAAAGYAVSGLVRPLLAFCAAPWQVLAIRCTDRVGKGLRTSPRDKLLAGSAAEGALAEAFSFHRGMDHLGAAIGPLCAAGLLWVWPGELRRVFLVASVFGGLALLVLLLVREPRTVAKEKVAEATDAGGTGAAGRREAGVPLPLLAAIGLFTLGNSSDALLLLRAQSLGVPAFQLPLLWTVLHLVRAGLSWPLGRAADRLGRRLSLACGWLWYALCYAAFALASTAAHAWVLFAAYGVVAGLTEGSERALVSAAVPEARRGAALGLYNLVSGLGLLTASVAAGLLWERVSPAAALGLGAFCAVGAAAALGIDRWAKASQAP
jgi:MFS family permease